MRQSRPLMLFALASFVMAGCAAQPAAETSAPTEARSTAEPTTSAAPPSAAAEPSEETTPSPSAEPTAACDLILAEVDAPGGTTASEPRLETLDDLRGKVAEAAEGSPARAAAELNLASYESMGLVERCVGSFNDAATGTTFASAALTFDDETGPSGYVDHLMEGCEAVDLPAAASVDASAIVCGAPLAPTAYLVVSGGTVAQSISVSPPPGVTFDQAAAFEQALALIELVPAP